MSEEVKFVYPHIEIGYEVEFASTEDAPEPSWCLAKVVRAKTSSVDLRVLSMARDVPKADVRHVGDPSFRKYPPRGDSGVFRLTKNQLELNGIRASQEQILRRMEALEQTFRAVMESQVSEETAAHGGRRTTRQTSGATV